MILREFLVIAAGDLWRMRLRAGLTISGVMIGIGALVSMLCLGHGMQKNISGEFRRMGLLRTLQVLPAPVPGMEGVTGSPGRGDDPDEAYRDSEANHGPADSSSSTVPSPPLDGVALEKIRAIEGVALVYPQESFDARIEWSGRTMPATVQALPAAFVEQRP